MKKKLIAAIAGLFILTLPLSLTACNKKDDSGLLKYYTNRNSVKEFTDYRTELTLPQNWSVLTTSPTNGAGVTDYGYISSIDAFVITNGNKENPALSIMKCGDTEPLFKTDAGWSAFRVKGNLIAAKSSDGTAAVFNLDGRTVLSRTKIGGSKVESASIDSVVKILDDGLIAVAGNCERTPAKDSEGNFIKENGVIVVSNTGTEGYTSIFRPTVNGDVSDRGTLVARIKNEADKSSAPLKNVLGFDGKYVSVTDNKTEGNNKKINRVYNIPYAVGEVGLSDATSNGRFVANDMSDYYAELTYIGGGRFLIHEDWTVNSDDAYTYFDGNEYAVVDRHIYHADVDALSPYVSNRIFLNLVNEYYTEADRGNIRASSFLNKGYMYASFGLVLLQGAEGVVAAYDQFILDGNLNVVLSLSGNFGITLQNQEYTDISAYDLIMDFVDGYGYMPLAPSSMRVYDRHGKAVYSKTQDYLITVGMNDGIFVAEKYTSSDDTTVFYGGYDLGGNLVIPFKYSKLDPFRGYYTIAEREDDNGKSINVLLGKDGAEVKKISDGNDALYDIATTDSGREIHKMGCYMYYTETNGVKKYGIKNLNANASKSVVMPAKMEAGCTLYSPINEPQNVFVFEKLAGAGSTYTYKIHRLI